MGMFCTGEDLEAGERPQLLLQRLHSFTDAVMASGGAGSSGLLGLVRKLQDGLAAAENLPVLTSHVSITSSSVRFGGIAPKPANACTTPPASLSLPTAQESDGSCRVLCLIIRALTWRCCFKVIVAWAMAAA